MAVRLEQYRQWLDRLGSSRIMTEPAAYFREKRLILNLLNGRLTYGLRRSNARQKEKVAALSASFPGCGARTIARYRERLNALAAALDAMSPLKVLGRGYSIAQREDGSVLSSVQFVAPRDALRLRLFDGELRCQVETVKKEKKT